MARISLLSLPLAAPGNSAAPRWPRLSERLLPWLLPLGLFALWWLASRNHWMSEQILLVAAVLVLSGCGTINTVFRPDAVASKSLKDSRRDRKSVV